MNTVERGIFAIVRWPLRALGFVIGTVYRTVFPGHEKQLAKHGYKEFARQIHKSIPFLFDEHNGQIVPNDQEPPSILDLATVTVATDDLRFMFNRDRGTVHVGVAPGHSPKDWQDLSALLKIIDGRETDYSRLPTIARLIQSHLQRIRDMLSAPEYQRTRQLLSGIYDDRFEATRRAEKALNKRLYGP